MGRVASITLAGNLALGVVALCGASGQVLAASVPQQFDARNYQAANAKAGEYCATLWSDHAFDPLRDKIPLLGEQPTASMLTSKERVRPEDKPLADLALKELLLDAPEDSIRKEIRQFASKSGKADVAVVFYAGHGAQLNGSNYLLPIDIDVPPTEADIQFAGLKVDDLINSIGSNTKIVFLDACRDLWEAPSRGCLYRRFGCLRLHKANNAHIGDLYFRQTGKRPLSL
jgi:hypothetical protein